MADLLTTYPVRELVTKSRSYRVWVDRRRALFGSWDPTWMPKVIASAFILGGGWLAVTAHRRACKTLARLSTHEFDPIPTPNFRVMAYGIATGSIVVTIGLWVLVEG